MGSYRGPGGYGILATFGGFAADVMRRRAVENQQQAEAARLDAESQKARAEQEFERARANFQMAREAVKKYQTAVAADPRLRPRGWSRCGAISWSRPTSSIRS